MRRLAMLGIILLGNFLVSSGPVHLAGAVADFATVDKILETEG